MQLIVYHSSRSYLEQSLAYLEKQAVVNSLLIGLANRTQSGFFFSVFKHGVILLSGARIGQRNLILTGQFEKANISLSKLITYLISNNIRLPGVFGPMEITQLFTDLWCKNKGYRALLDFNEMIYQATKVKPIRPAPGNLLKATKSHQDLVEEWIVAFSKEAGEPKTLPEATKMARNKIDRGEFYIWWYEDKPVTMAATTRPTQHTISINSVYTPAEHRRLGYATNCVHAITDKMLKSYSAVTLFTDLKNPISNSIYQQIGYVPVKEFLQIKFEYS